MADERYLKEVRDVGLTKDFEHLPIVIYGDHPPKPSAVAELATAAADKRLLAKICHGGGGQTII